MSGGASGQHQRCRHALQVPLEGAANGLVEVVDVEDEASVGRGVGAQVAHVGVAAELADDAGRGKLGQVRSHYRRGAAKKGEGRLGHELVLEGDERGHAAAHGPLDNGRERRLAAP